MFGSAQRSTDTEKTKESKRLESIIDLFFEGRTVGRILIAGMPCLGILQSEKNGSLQGISRLPTPAFQRIKKKSDRMCGEGMLRGEFGH